MKAAKITMPTEVANVDERTALLLMAAPTVAAAAVSRTVTDTAGPGVREVNATTVIIPAQLERSDRYTVLDQQIDDAPDVPAVGGAHTMQQDLGPGQERQASGRLGKLKPWVISSMIIIGCLCGPTGGWVLFGPLFFCCIFCCPGWITSVTDQPFGKDDIEELYPARVFGCQGPDEGRHFQQASCAICLEDFETGESLRALDCRHEFHAACLDPWVMQNVAGGSGSQCPLCKHPIKLGAKAAAAQADDTSLAELSSQTS